MKHKAKYKQAQKLTIYFTIIFALFFTLKTFCTPGAAGPNICQANPEAYFAGEDYTPENISLRLKARCAPVKTAQGPQPAAKAGHCCPGQAADCNLRVYVDVCNKGPTTAQNVRLEVPLLGNLDSPYQTLIQENFSMKPLQIREHCLGNRSAVFKIATLAPGKTEKIVLDYSLLITPLQADLSLYEPAPALCGKQQPDPLFLQPAAKIESSNPELAAKAEEITLYAENNLEKAEAIFDYVLAHMHYDPESPGSNCGALAALRGCAGVCEDYAALFVALCRAEKIPARLVYGYTNPQGWEEVGSVGPGKALSLTGCRHCWAEFYLEGMGWLPADPTLNTYHRAHLYFAALPQAGHLAQNYADKPLQVCFQGGQIDVTWAEKLTGLPKL